MSSWNRGPAGFGQPLNYAGANATPGVATAFFNAVYGWMAAGLGVTAVVAFLVAANAEQLRPLLSGGALIGLIIAELVLVVAVVGATNRISAGVATVLFLLYSALNGITLSSIVMVYTHAALGTTFLTTAAMFGAMSIYGMFTQTDLTRFGNLLFMALIGIVIASLVNLFFHNPTIMWMISYLGVAIFCGLTAYDTQRLKAMAYQTSGDAAVAARYSVIGALILYLDFLNLFLFLLRIMGNNGRRQ
jgi:uncharacterized protein